MPLPFLKRSASPSPSSDPPAKHIEIWGHFVATHLFFKRLAIASTLLSFFALALATYGVLFALHRPLVFHVDPEGRATAMGRLSSSHAPVEAEVRYVAKRFLKTTMAFHSDTVEADLADAWNLMTDELRARFEKQFSDYERERGMSFVAFVKRQQIRTVLDIRSVEVDNHNDRAWSVRARGVARTWPLSRVGEDAAFQAREFEAQLTLVRAPRTELTPNGLLVRAQATRFFEVPDPAALQEQRVNPR